MYSKIKAKLKNKFRAFFLIPTLSILALSGCDSRVGEDPPPVQAQEFSGTQCLTDAKPVVGKFLAGTATEAELSTLWSCAITAIDKFKKYVRGKDMDRFSSQELATFLEKNFMEPSATPVITPKLQAEFMKVKGLLFGGSHSFLTFKELEKTTYLITKLHEVTVQLNPYMKVVAMTWKPAKTPATAQELKYFEDANVAMQKAAKTLAKVFENSGQGYVISDFVVLMEELSHLFGEKWKFPGTIKTYLPIVKKVKKAVAGGSENTITPSEWRRFSVLGVRGYVQYLRYENFINKVPMNSHASLRLSYINRTIEDVFSAFEDLLVEKPEGNISQTELFELLSALEAAFPAVKVSPVLVSEGMKLKQLFFTGTAKNLVASDFKVARSKISKLIGIVEKLNPHLEILTNDWEPTKHSFIDAQKKLRASRSVLETVSSDLAALIEGNYDLKDIEVLIKEIERLYPASYPTNKGINAKDLSSKVSELMPLLVDFKNMLYAQKDSIIYKKNWKSLLSVAANSYGEALYFNYFVKGRSLHKAQGISAFSTWINQVFDLGRVFVKEKHSQYFLRSELLSILNRLEKLGYTPQGIRGQIADQALQIILNNVMVTPEARLEGKRPDVLNLSAIENGRNEFNSWVEAEILFVRIGENWKSSEGYTIEKLVSYLREVSATKSTSATLRNAVGELLLAAQTPVAITTNEEGFVKISNKQKQYYSFQSLRALNRDRMVARLLIRSFGSSLHRIQSYQGVNLFEVQTAFNSLRGIFIELGLIDPGNLTFAASRFREANIFMPHSDGNQLASQAEVTDLIGMIWSGINIHTKLRVDLVKKCFSKGAVVTDKSMISVQCASSTFRQSMERVMTATPEFIRFVRGATPEVWNDYIMNIFSAAGYYSNSRGLAKMGDISLSPHIVQYIEMVFARFDTNSDNVFSSNEAIRAYPAFTGLMHELAAKELEAGDIKPAELIDLFAFILRYGKPPTTLKEKARYFFLWKGKREKWDIWADRLQMARILGYVGEQVNKPVSAAAAQR